MKRMLILVLFLVAVAADTYAQCAMCKSVVESNIDGGSPIGSGLNDGILYLMAMPYLALAIIAFAWLRYNKRVKA
ncbi:MAG: hypothetical protein CMC95_06070 [Flavobacteriales bacterium]|nr:hypothetical protein [Flavobacteriales bacterium]